MASRCVSSFREAMVIQPQLRGDPAPTRRRRALRKDRNRTGRVVARVAQQIHTTADANSSLQFAQDTIRFSPRWDARRWLAADPQASDSIAARRSPNMNWLSPPYCLTSGSLSRHAWRAFVDFQRDWRARCPAQDCFFLGYANGYYGYFPTISAASWVGTAPPRHQPGSRLGPVKECWIKP